MGVKELLVEVGVEDLHLAVPFIMDFAQVWRAGGLRRGLSSLSYLL
jgi:hypothetical protein